MTTKTKTKTTQDNGQPFAEEISLLKAILAAKEGDTETLEGIILGEKQQRDQFIANAERQASAMSARIVMLEGILEEANG